MGRLWLPTDMTNVKFSTFILPLDSTKARNFKSTQDSKFVTRNF